MTSQIICQHCDEPFDYTDAEREFRQERGLARPLLCPTCRQRDRQRRNGDLVNLYMRTDSFDPFLLGENTQAGSTSRNTQDIRTMYDATCAACGESTRVPFIPRNDRPVYCKDCFNARKGR
ncbi:MAG: zinc-ribbon domain containing protein [Thermomicrobiales bacterium]|nr:zinc-ribbon domain containing protein [Thermomicrobiales bacterium]MCO5218526.1 zinc-ribbon domain containing protein [Thermomicrobiales bacterium]MCO5224814.1 zinc-ribbon domain containing protein [Thermomicrobiales bacterium]